MNGSNVIPIIEDNREAYKKFFAKFMHGIAVQCDCLVTYNKETDKIIFKGPQIDIDYVINEAAELLNIDPKKFRKLVIK